MRGGSWPVLNRIVTAIIWLGIQMYWGGQSIKIIFNPIIDHPFRDLVETLPASLDLLHHLRHHLSAYSSDTARKAPGAISSKSGIFVLVPVTSTDCAQITFIMITRSMFGILG